MFVNIQWIALKHGSEVALTGREEIKWERKQNEGKEM